MMQIIEMKKELDYLKTILELMKENEKVKKEKEELKNLIYPFEGEMPEKIFVYTITEQEMVCAYNTAQGKNISKIHDWDRVKGEINQRLDGCFEDMGVSIEFDNFTGDDALAFEGIDDNEE